MPIYEYQCRSCAEQFETLVLKGTVAECPACHGRDLEQLLSGFAVSSDGIRQANAKAARRAAVANPNFKEQKVAHAEYVKKHAEE
jgi:putative FmdB family regulatory protein